MEKKNFLSNIIILRVFATLSIIAGHSLAIYTSAWRNPYSSDVVVPLRILGFFFNSYHLALFTFISGYLYAHSLNNGHFTFNLGRFYRNKAVRLLFPYGVFGVLYFWIFNLRESSAVGKDFLMEMLSGIGHLWYLLMLFNLFVLYSTVQFLLKIKMDSSFVFFLLILLYFLGGTLIFNKMNWLQLGSTLKYVVFFHFGVMLYGKASQFYDHFARRLMLAGSSILYLILFALKFLGANYIRYSLGYDEMRIFMYHELMSLLLGLISVLIIFALGSIYFTGLSTTNSRLLRVLNANSFGLYLVHQIVMMLVLYKGLAGFSLSPYFIPPILFLVTLLLTLLIVDLIKRTAFGKVIIR